MFDQLAKEIISNDKVTLFGFGSFKRVKREEKGYKHPVTGEITLAPERYSIKFDLSAIVRRDLNELMKKPI